MTGLTVGESPKLLVAYAEQGFGAVLMINSNDNTGALERSY
jgi:hypothetical protein